MRIIQFEIPEKGRRVGVVSGEAVHDLTEVQSELSSTREIFAAAQEKACSFEAVVQELAEAAPSLPFPFRALHDATPGGEVPFLHPPVDHADPHYVLISGTGLTHTGSMQSRDEMHSDAVVQSAEPQTDSARMFAMGLEGGKPEEGERGAAPEWFYKGNGTNLRGHRSGLEVPAFALDGGEEPELVGCYIIDRKGIPCRLGFALGNEWSDHATEKINYLYLAPSKLRSCAIGPELITDCDFQDISLKCNVRRGAERIYESGELHSGELFMSHSLANCEDHHFKYAQHRQPGDVHLHFFGTSKLSYSTRHWKYETGDEIRIESPDFSSALVNRVVLGDDAARHPVRVKQA